MRLSSEVSRGSWGGRGGRGGGKGEGERDRSTIVGIVPPSPLGVYIYFLIDVYFIFVRRLFCHTTPSARYSSVTKVRAVAKQKPR